MGVLASHALLSCLSQKKQYLNSNLRISPALNWDLGGQGLQDLPHKAQIISPLLSPTMVIP